jgi:hypothetical protein
MIDHDGGHDAATSRLSSLPRRAAWAVFADIVAAAAQKGHSRLNLGGPRESRRAA